MIASLNTRLIDLTVGDLLQLIDDRMKGFDNAEMSEKKDFTEKEYVYGIDGIADLFSVSNSTAKTYKKTWLKPAIYQSGRTIMTDKEMAIELFKEQDISRKLRVKSS